MNEERIPLLQDFKWVKVAIWKVEFILPLLISTRPPIHGTEALILPHDKHNVPFQAFCAVDGCHCNSLSSCDLILMHKSTFKYWIWNTMGIAVVPFWLCKAQSMQVVLGFHLKTVKAHSALKVSIYENVQAESTSGLYLKFKFEKARAFISLHPEVCCSTLVNIGALQKFP